MKVFQVIPTLAMGGAERFVCELSNELVRNNIDVTIITLYKLDEISSVNKILLDKRVKVIELDKKPGLDFFMFGKLRSIIKREKPDIAHFHVRAIIYALYSSISNKKTKHFATIHSEASREAGDILSKYARKFMFKHGYCKAVTISDESLVSFEKFYGFTTPLIINGVAPWLPDKPINPLEKYKGKVLVHVASVQPVKNQMRLIKAFERILDDGIDASLVMIGKNNGYKEIYEDMQTHFNDRIVHLGMRTDAKYFMKNAYGMCLSSDMEGMPMTIIEAFSVGCIPLATPVGGCKNMIDDGRNGMLSQDLSVDSYYRMLRDFLALPESDYLEMKKEAYNSFDKYDIKNTATAYIELFKK